MRPVLRTDPDLLRYLEKDRIPALNIAGILENEPQVEVLVNDGPVLEGVLVKGPRLWYLHTESDAFLETVCDEMSRKDGFYQFSGMWKPLADRIKDRFRRVWDAPCDLYYLPEGNQVKPRPDSPARSIDPRDAEIIDTHYTYRHPGTVEKIRKCIQERSSSAIYVDGQIVSWLLVHEDNSLGIMYTLEEHRRKGYAVEVSLDVIAKQLAAGRTPFLQIRDNNDMSPDLAKKCGFVQHGKCDWFGVMVGLPKVLIEEVVALRRSVLETLCPEGFTTESLRGLGGATQQYLLAPAFPPAAAEAVLADLRGRGYAAARWITTPLDDTSGVQALVAAGHLRSAGERICLGQFLVDFLPDAADPDPVVDQPQAAWLEAVSRIEDRRLLDTALERMGSRLHRVGNAQGSAGLMDDGDGGFELLWTTSREPEFLRRVLRCAKGRRLNTAIVHVEAPEAGVYESLGFFTLYREQHYLP